MLEKLCVHTLFHLLSAPQLLGSKRATAPLFSTVN